MPVINYYDLLGVDTSADAETLRSRVREERKLWTKRQNHPNPETRATAERRVHQLSEAEETLLDTSRRASYDRQLATQAPAPTASAVGAMRDWAAVAREYLANGQVQQAGFAAREATTADPDNAQAWALRAQCSVELGNRGEAEFEASEAARLEPNEPLAHVILGDIYSSAEDWARARASYQRALDLDPGNPYLRGEVVRARAAQGDLRGAEVELEALVREFPHEDDFRRLLTLVIAEKAESAWSTGLEGEKYLLSQMQINETKQALSRINRLGALASLDPDIRAEIEEMDRLVRRAETVRWHPSQNFGWYIGGAVVLFIIGVATLASGLGILFLLLVGLIVWVFTVRHRMPTWQYARKTMPRAVARSGLQDPSGA